MNVNDIVIISSNDTVIMESIGDIDISIAGWLSLAYSFYLHVIPPPCAFLTPVSDT